MIAYEVVVCSTHLYGFEVVLVVEDLDRPLLSLPPDIISQI